MFSGFPTSPTVRLFTHLCPMRVIITAATVAEWMPSFLEMNNLYTSESNRFKVQFHQTGVGMLATAVSLTRLVMEEKPDLIIQAGIAGCFDTSMALGKVVVINEESLADMGVEEDGKWKDIFDLKLEKSSYHPFVEESCRIHGCQNSISLNYPKLMPSPSMKFLPIKKGFSN